MRDLTKAERKKVKELIKRGILRRHAQWQQEMRELLNQPFNEETENEFTRSIQITDRARKFYKEAMELENYYGTQMLTCGLQYLLIDGYLKTDELSELPEDLKDYLRSCIEHYKD